MHRYRLATYRECKAHREWNTTCPDCGRKGKFSPYIDTVTMRPVDDRQCGRCSRLSNCGYHLPPREMPRTEDYGSRESQDYSSQKINSHANLANHAKFASLHSRIVPRQHSAMPTNASEASVLREICEIRVRQNNQREQERHYEKMRCACEQSQPWGSHLVTWLRTKFPREQVDAALKRYHVGGTPDGATLWWQIDEQGRVHTGKAMQYNPLTGHRVKEQGFPVNWAHRMRRYGEPSELVVPQCLFGEHLASPPDSLQARLLGADKSAVVANDAPFLVVYQGEGAGSAMQDSPPWEGLGEAPLCLVESEKTALIMSLIKPDRVWLATGGKANFKEQMLWPLLGYEVAVYPDADALHDWAVRIAQLNRELGHRLYIPTGYYNLMDHDEARREGWDLADILLREEGK